MMYKDHLTKIAQGKLFFLVFTLGLLAAAYVLLTHGIGFNVWAIYGLGNAATVLSDWQPYYAFSQFMLFTKATLSPLSIGWSGLVKTLYVTPSAFIIVALLSRALLYVLIYAVALPFTRHIGTTLLVATLGVLFWPRQYGISMSDFWGHVTFDNHHISVLLLLFGVALLIRERLFAGSAFVALAMHFHPLNVTVSYVFIAAPIAFGYLKQQKYKSIFWLGFFPALSVLFFSLNIHLPSNLTLATSDLTVGEWFGAAMNIPCGNKDSSAIYNTLTFVPFMVPLMLSTFALTSKGELERNTVLFFLLASISLMGMECLHRAGIYFGELTVTTTVFATYRGFWVIVVFCIIATIKHATSFGEDKAISTLVCFVAIHTLMNSVVSSLAVSLTAIHIAKRDNHHWKSLLLLFMFSHLAFALSTAGFFEENLTTTWSFSNTLPSLALCGITLTMATAVNGPLRPWQPAILILASMLLMPKAHTIISNIKQTREILKHSQVNYVDLLRVDSGYSTETIEYSSDILKAARPYSHSGPILAPPEIPFGLALAMKVPLYVSPYDIYFVFNHRYAMDYNHRLLTLYGKKIHQVHDAQYPRSMMERYTQLDGNHLKSIMHEVGIPVAITLAPLLGFETIYKNSRYYLIRPIS